MPPQFIDSHVHLWPAHAANVESHAWMAEVASAREQHLMPEYMKAVQCSKARQLPKIIYIETDRKYEYNSQQPLEVWAAGPLQEIKDLRSMVEHGGEDAGRFAGIVLWAPVDRGEAVFDEWLQLAEQTAGPSVWKLVKGFRFLLQGIHSQSEFARLLSSGDFIHIVTKLGSRGFAFDVGVDQAKGGLWQLQEFIGVLEKVADSGSMPLTTFILNHLCKPDLSRATSDPEFDQEGFRGWEACMRKFATFPNVFMKLSGAFSGMRSDKWKHREVKDMAERIRPWTDTIFDAFGPERIMYGGDWPVCNIFGPAQESWSVWLAVTKQICADRHVPEGKVFEIYAETAKRAYKL